MWQITNIIKHKKTKHKNDNIPYDKIQMQQNSKRHNTNVTNRKKTYCKYDKRKKDKTQMWQNTKGLNTNVTNNTIIHNNT